jgi:PelA/Pel-15E family pectate lyase
MRPHPILFIIVYAGILQTVPVGAQNMPRLTATQYDIDHCVNTFSLSHVESTKAGYQYWFADKDFLDGRTLKLSVVRPHEATHAPHQHGEDEFFFILEGRAEFFLNGKTRIVEPYTSLYCPPNVMHGIRNVGDSELKYLVIKKYALTAPSETGKGDSVSTANFQDSAHHWRDIHDEDQEITPEARQPRYPESEVEHIADNILLYQKSNGGWPKNYDMRAILTDAQRKTLAARKNSRATTFDNGATHSQIQYLAEAFARTHKFRYRNACLKGVDFILSSQQPSGGWPQFFPDTSGYRRFITFNDGAMVGVMGVLGRIAGGEPEYTIVDDARREKARLAFARGIKCILRCQIKESLGLTGWCQQHDNHDFKPRPARTFEPVAISGLESADIVLLLMSIQNPSPEVVKAVQGAVQWFDRSRVRGVTVKVVPARHEHYKYHDTDIDRILVTDPAAPPLWARYYEIGTNVPLFCNRDGKLVYSLAEVERERRTGYRWYSDVPAKVFKAYQPWQRANAPTANIVGVSTPPDPMSPPLDTSFTTLSAWQKMRTQYPQAVPADAQPSPSVTEWANLVYTAYGYRYLALDLFVPADTSKGPWPVVLIIHGGGWRSGNRAMEIPMARTLAANGYAAAVVEYRLSKEAQYPAGVHDLKAAVRWTRAHAMEFGIDPTRIAVMGASAGGTLAALLGTTGDNKLFEGAGTHAGVSSAVQAIVDIDGVVDFTDSSESGRDTDTSKPSAGKYWFGAAYRDRPDLWKQASALNWVSAQTPATIFINSSLDRFHAGRDPMVAKLKALGIYCEVHPIPGTPHPFWLMRPWFDETVRHVVGFLDKVLKKAP